MNYKYCKKWSLHRWLVWLPCLWTRGHISHVAFATLHFSSDIIFVYWFGWMPYFDSLHRASGFSISSDAFSFCMGRFSFGRKPFQEQVLNLAKILKHLLALVKAGKFALNKLTFTDLHTLVARNEALEWDNFRGEELREKLHPRCSPRWTGPLHAFAHHCGSARTQSYFYRGAYSP